MTGVFLCVRVCLCLFVCVCCPRQATISPESEEFTGILQRLDDSIDYLTNNVSEHYAHLWEWACEDMCVRASCASK